LERPPSLMYHRRAGFFSRVHLRFEAAEGGTLVHLLNDGYPEEAEYNDVYDYFSRAWPEVLEGLKEAIEP
jgi:hypothetical protein